MDGFKRNLKTGVVEAWKDGEKVSEVVTTGDCVIRETEKRNDEMDSRAAVEAWIARRNKRLASKTETHEDRENEPEITVKGSHILINGNLKLPDTGE